MDHRETDNRRASHQEQGPTQRSVPIRTRSVAPPPQAANPAPIKVLARMPNLEAEPTSRRSHRRSRRSRREGRRQEGRIVSSRIAAPLMVAAGLLLLAAAVVPSFMRNKETADAPDQGEPPVWNASESDPWTNSAPVWDAESVREFRTTPPQDVAAAPVKTADGTATAAPFRPAEPQTLQAQASPPAGTGRAGAEHAEGAISSWRDPGQWPYGNGVGRPQSAASQPDRYYQPAEQTASFDLPEGVQGSPIPYLNSGEPVEAGVSHAAAPAEPQVGMNRSMALDQNRAAPYADSTAAGVQASPPTAADYWGNPAEPVYSADARGGPSTVYPSAYPQAATPGPGSVVDPYGSSGSPIGTVIPGGASAGSYGAGGSQEPQGPGVARLQGVIEKPSPRTTYDYNRSSIH